MNRAALALRFWAISMDRLALHLLGFRIGLARIQADRGACRGDPVRRAF